MFTLKEVQTELLNRYNQSIELDALEEYVHIWDIDTVITPEENDEMFDESSVRKLYRGLKLKLGGYNQRIINEILSKTTYNKQSQPHEHKLIDEEQQEITDKMESAKKLAHQTNPTKTSVNNNVINIISKETVENNKKEPEPKSQPSSGGYQKLVTQLSDNVANKVASQLLAYLKDGELVNNLEDMGALKRDNEILSKQVKELLKVNAELEEKIFDVELKNSSYKKIWKNFYFKAINE